MLAGRYDLFLVLISFVVAMLASYTALDLSGRIASAKGAAVRYWISGGALAMGFGIWSMHFIGMLAFKLPIPLGYDLTFTVGSLILAILTSGLALWLVSQPDMSWRDNLLGALIMGAGISSMHYLGMGALRMQPGIVYDPVLVVASLLVATAASGSALRIAFALRRRLVRVKVMRGGAAVIMGFAIVGMHYIGMAAANFPEGSYCAAAVEGLDTQWLASLVIVITVAILAITLLLSLLDARLAAKTELLSSSLARANRKLMELALQDSLTKLPNRLLLEERINECIARARRHGRTFAVMFLDLDGFKPINDAFGHHTGDELLCVVANRLNGHMRSRDTLARVGGDEFVLLAEISDGEDVSAIAEQIIELVNRPFPVGEHELRISTSVGIALYPRDGDNKQELLMNADAAMYHAKHNGRNDYSFFEPAMNVDARAQLKLLHELRLGIEREELVLHFQPKFCASTGAPMGAEALVRWQHPELGLLAPDRFIGLAEQAGLITRIDEWVLNAAARQLQAWRAAGHTTWQVAVNISGLHVRHHGLVGHVRDVLARYDLPAQNLAIEITETMAVRDAEAIAMLEELAALGVCLSIDDFGSGYSSLSYIKRLPVRELKIDRSFISEVCAGGIDAAIVASVVTLGRALNLRVVAEGIEDAEQQALLSELGCDVLQGFWLGRPVPASQFLASGQPAVEAVPTA
ncbi:diguanylate cyclase/phosphodiesterase [Halopseudomonas xinjiangensis]|uniref:Diguanylate cyclase/phosphodiesterase n=1 Tax=Halopseudomonas xinjiangensis TaxID=487184 RepID=A0A1H1PDP8_9GAMM|nr:bifunctional diguanylate cyclase/phosphodiesterase [Halopseudomonas xinjiangensis]SDS08729.1 diguanylate cyclase/phosphodiesterase [Halopseudomonas xinjiangensis]